MDLTTSIIGLVMLGLFVIPMSIMTIKNKKKNKALLNELQTVAAENKCDISKFDIHPRFAIGLSSAKDHLFFIRKNGMNDGYIKHCIRLDDVKDCSVKMIKHAVKLKKTEESVLDKIELSFVNRSKNEKPQNYLLYDSEITPQPDNEIHLANKWRDIIKQAI